MEKIGPASLGDGLSMLKPGELSRIQGFRAGGAIDALLASTDSADLDRLVSAAASECGYHEQLEVPWSYWHYGRHAEHADELGMRDLSALLSAAWAIDLEIHSGGGADGRQEVEDRIRQQYCLATGGALGELSAEERKAVFDFRATHGDHWKEDLFSGWMRAAFPGPLQRIRNAHGPEWLHRVCDSEFAPFEQVVRCEEETLPLLRSLGVECGDYNQVSRAVTVVATHADFDRIAEFPADFEIVQKPAAVPPIASHATDQTTESAVHAMSP